MSFISRLFRAGRARRTPESARRSPSRPAVELLENRIAPATLTVTDLSDSAADPGSLRYAVGAASDGDTIQFRPGLRGTITLTSGELELPASVTITGPGAGSIAVNGGGASRVFEVDEGATVSISGLTIAGGSASSGAGIYDGGALSVSGCTFSGNSASDTAFAAGGAIDDESSSPLTVSDCTFSANSAAGTSGGALVGGGAIDVSWGGAALTISGCSFSGNTAGGAGGLIGGGAISILGGGCTVTVGDSTFAGNSTTDFGGALFNGGGGCTFTFSNTTFAGNSAVTGGALFNGGGGCALTFGNSTLAGNTAVTGGAYYDGGSNGLTLTNCTVAGNSATGTGGGLDLGSGTTNLNNTIVAGNTDGSGPNDVIHQGRHLNASHSLIQSAASGFINGTDGGGNLLGVDPLLGALRDNGGVVETMALRAGSPAIGSGDSALAAAAGLTTDARGTGYPRVVNGLVDMGAYQSHPTSTVLQSSAATVVYGQGVTFTATVSSPPPGTPTGAVTFYDGATSLGSAPLGTTRGVTTASLTVRLAAGSHTITASYAGDNSFSFSTSGPLPQGVTRATLTVVANGATRSYGRANPALTASYLGFVPGDTAGVLSGRPALATAATAASAPGNYLIGAGAGTLAAANYQFRFVNGTLAVTPAPLSAVGLPVRAAAGIAFSGPVAAFVNADPFGNAASYLAAIDWGDGHVSAGVVVSAGGVLVVMGSHTYATPANRAVTVTICHKRGFTATAQTSAAALVLSVGRVSNYDPMGLLWEGRGGRMS